MLFVNKKERVKTAGIRKFSCHGYSCRQCISIHNSWRAYVKFYPLHCFLNIEYLQDGVVNYCRKQTTSLSPYCI